LKAFNLTGLTAPGYEADDILGTLAKKLVLLANGSKFFQ
jgi:5'-3' exonuclease